MQSPGNSWIKPIARDDPIRTSQALHSLRLTIIFLQHLLFANWHRHIVNVLLEVIHASRGRILAVDIRSTCRRRALGVVVYDIERGEQGVALGLSRRKVTTLDGFPKLGMGRSHLKQTM